MPTKRRRRAQDRREGFTAFQREHLLTGFDLIQRGYGRGEPFEPFDEDAAHGDWQDYRAELMAFWGQDPAAWARENKPGFGNPAPGGPGTRPWAWWAFESPADGRRVVGLAPVDEQARRVMGVLYRRHVLVEAQAEYLRRRHLLVDGELERIPAAAFEPVDTYWPEMARQLEVAAEGKGGNT